MSFELELFFDGDCPLCAREVRWLRRLDRDHVVRFTDIAAPDFDPAPLGRTMATLMGEIHARRADGSWLRGADVFRALYARLGFAPLVRVSRLPVVRPLVDRAYRLFARHRLRLTGRDAACTSDRCALHATPH